MPVFRRPPRMRVSAQVGSRPVVRWLVVLALSIGTLVTAVRFVVAEDWSTGASFLLVAAKLGSLGYRMAVHAGKAALWTWGVSVDGRFHSWKSLGKYEW